MGYYGKKISQISSETILLSPEDISENIKILFDSTKF